MRIKNLWKVVATLAAVVLFVAGCAAPTPTPTPTPQPTPTPAPAPAPTPKPAPTPTSPQGDLRIALSTLSMERFDPSKASAGDHVDSLGVLFDFMFRLNGAQLAPGVVEKWEMSSDGMSWVYNIRKGIKFHNGDTLTAKDVKFTLERYQDKDAYFSFIRDAVERIELVDDYTVRVYTKGNQPFLPVMSSYYTPAQGLVVPKDYFERNGAQYFERHPVGSGPFKFARHVPADLIEYEALDSHWRQVPAFKRLTLILAQEGNTRVAMMKTGAVDVIDIDVESGIELERAGFKTAAMNTDQATVLLMGTHSPKVAGMPTADVRVRQALSLAINRDEIRQTFFHGKAGPPAPPYIWAGSADVDFPFWQDYAAKAYRYDPEEAKRLLKDAGYPNGFSFKLFSFVMSGNPYLPKLAEVVQGYWLKVGVKTEIVPMDWATFRNKAYYLNSAEVIGQAAPFSMSGGPITPLRLRAGFHSKGTVFLLNSPELDKLLDNALTEMNPAQRKEIQAKAIKTITDSYTNLVIASPAIMYATSPKVDMPFTSPVAAVGIYVENAKPVK